MNESALRPVKIRLDIYGCGNYNGTTIPFPTVYIDDALSQNILYYCYDESLGIEDLAKICGVPAYYIEERIDNLLKREAIVESPKGKYRTDFIIWSDKYGIYCEENGEKALLPIMDKLLDALNNIAKEADGIDFYKAEKSRSDLYYLYGVMAFAYASTKYCKLPYPSFPKRYDGNDWCYMGNMETGKHRRIGVGRCHNTNLFSRGSYSHTSYNFINGISYRNMMTDNCINACEDILLNGSSEDIDSVSLAIQNDYIEKRPDGSFFVTVPAFTKSQYADFEAIADKYLAPLMDTYTEIVNQFVAGYKKLFPKHLNEDADRMCQSMFYGMFTVVVNYAQRTAAIPMPSENCFCDVLIQFKES